MGFEVKRFITRPLDSVYICSICCEVFKDAVQCNDEHVFCRQCITDWLNQSATCPIDRRELYANGLKAVSRNFQYFLDHLDIRCEFAGRGCEVITKLDQTEAHSLVCRFSDTSVKESECKEKRIEHLEKHVQELMKRNSEKAATIKLQDEKIANLHKELNQRDNLVKHVERDLELTRCKLQDRTDSLKELESLTQTMTRIVRRSLQDDDESREANCEDEESDLVGESLESIAGFKTSSRRSLTSSQLSLVALTEEDFGCPLPAVSVEFAKIVQRLAEDGVVKSSRALQLLNAIDFAHFYPATDPICFREMLLPVELEHIASIVTPGSRVLLLSDKLYLLVCVTILVGKDGVVFSLKELEKRSASTKIRKTGFGHLIDGRRLILFEPLRQGHYDYILMPHAEYLTEPRERQLAFNGKVFNYATGQMIVRKLGARSESI